MKKTSQKDQMSQMGQRGQMGQRVLVGAAAVLAVGAGAAAQLIAPAVAQQGDVAEAATAVEGATCGTGESEAEAVRESAFVQVKADEVAGDFTYTQDELSTNEEIAGVFRRVTAALCGSTYKQVEDTRNWEIAVGGDVMTEFTATLAELSPESTRTSVITCACSNNGAGGAAIVNARVSGIGIAELAARAGILPEVNAVRFTAADGTVSTLPLTYLITHGALIAYSLNDEDLSQSVGGSNQLWIDSSAGKYFLRDVTSVEFLALDEVPDAPQLETTEYEYVNRPNVGMETAA